MCLGTIHGSHGLEEICASRTVKHFCWCYYVKVQINVCLLHGFGWIKYQFFLPVWDMIFRVWFHGIWNRHNAWVFSEEKVSSEGIIW